MGLDQYARWRSSAPTSDVDFEIEDGDETFWRWRKHPDLQGWMEDLWREKGGQGQPGMDGPHTFNCAPVVLTPEDLDRLEKDVQNRGLPKTVGFFFGESRDSDYADTLKFITRARQAIAEGKTVYYDSWW